jgi:hypothetical protein
LKKSQYNLASISSGPSTPPFDAVELKRLLANAADTRTPANSADIEDAPGFYKAREVRSESLRDEKPGSLHPERSYIPSELVTMSQLKDLFQAVLECKPQASADNGPAGPEKRAENSQDSENKRILASRMEYKTVNEAYVQHCPYSTSANYKRSWDSKAYEYKIVDSPPPQDVSELDEFVFVVRKRIRKYGRSLQFFDCLTCVQKNKRTMSSSTWILSHQACETS